MTHHHAIFKDESTEQTIGSHQLPKPLNWKVLVQPHQVKMKITTTEYLPLQFQTCTFFLTGQFCLKESIYSKALKI